MYVFYGYVHTEPIYVFRSDDRYVRFLANTFISSQMPELVTFPIVPRRNVLVRLLSDA